MDGWKNSIQLSTLLCCCLAVVKGQLTVTSLPVVLFNGGSQSIVEGSVIWLYCEVDSVSPSLRVTWNKDNVPLEQDVPHIRMRSSSITSSSTFLLVVDNFRSSDGGTYQCIAEDGVMAGNGSTLTLTASTSSPGSLQIITNDATITSSTLGTPPDNRTGYAIGDMASLNFVAGHVDDNITMYPAPTVLWLKNGTPTRATPTNTLVGSNGRLSTTLSFSFQESDAGVYQCVFTGNNSELFVTIPIRLDTGETLTIESVSPTAIVLRPPEKLVLEVRATGRYNFIEWSRNGASFATAGAFQPQIPEEFPHFYEIYVHEPTTTDDLGLYEVYLVPSLGQQSPDEVDIAVTSPVDPNTTIVGSSVVTVVEGRSVNIFCISTGVPVPIITWKLNNQITSFSQTDVSTDFEVKVIRQQDLTLVPEVTIGNIVSTLHIENTQYSAHNGVYECIGKDPDNTSVSSTAMITVQVEVIPEVDVTADVIRVAVGGDVTLTCTVTRANPMIYAYTWTNVDTSITLLGETSATLTLSSVNEEEIATYRCDVTNSAGTGSDTITIEQAFPPVVSSRINPPGPVVLGSTVDLVCEASVGDLPISFTWTDPNGVSVNPTDTDGTISITLSSGDYGTYTCTATNAVGMNTAVVDVVLAVSPSVGLPSGSTATPEVVAGLTLTLSVSISDFNINLTSISWTKDGSSLTSGQARVTITNPTLPATTAPVNSTLQLTSALPSDSGSYVITSTNAAGSDNFTFSISITDPVTITDPPNNTTVSGDERDRVIFICTARGVPVPSITWSQVAGSRITISTTSPMADSEGYISITSTLTISGLKRDDNGSYACNATNTIMGSVEMETITFTLAVNFMPSIFMTPVASVTVVLPNSVSLNCMAKGVPSPLITWIRSGGGFPETEYQESSTADNGRIITITNTPLGVMVTSVFTIDSTLVLDTASYICMASNDLGSANSSSTAITVHAPVEVTDPTNDMAVSEDEGTLIILNCTARGVPTPSFTWSRGSHPIMEDSRITITSSLLPDSGDGYSYVTSMLSILNSRQSEIDIFSCNAVNTVTMGRTNRTEQDSRTFYHTIFFVQGQLNVTSLPAVLFNGGSQSIVEGSVIWLYCEVDSVSPSLRVTWKKDNVPLTQDVPHIRTRSSINTNSSTFLLVVDNFKSSDDGIYQCTAEDGAMTGNGFTLILTASTSSPGSLQIITNDAAITSGIPPDNRTGYEVGDVASLNFVIGHVNDDTTMYTPPTVLWLKDGFPTRAIPTYATVGSNGRLSTTLSFYFQESDAGVYQCVFTGTNSELFVTIPIRLDTGETLTLESVSPTAIVLRPPEKLVLEVSSTGRYNFIEWNRNGASFASGGAFQPQIPKEFPHFYEIYVHEPTNTDDLGLYEVVLVPSPGQQSPDDVDIAVITPVDPNTTFVGSSVVRVVEGGSVNISCISTGVPVPIITWKLNNLITSFSQTDVSTDFSARVIRQGETLVPEVTSGNIVSTLHIEGAQYPAHNGIYECIGTDPDNTSVSSIAMITVQVEVIPEVDVTADVIRVADGGDVTLTCTVTRAIPMIYTYTWTNVDTSITLPGETSASLTLSSITEEEIATYRCDVTNSAGTGSDTITIEQAFPPVVSSRINPPGPVVLGSTVDLVCEASVGDPPINFTWTDPNGVSVNPTDTDGTISITLSSGDYGTYTCTATNAVGMNTAVVDVVLAVSPSVGLPSGSTATPEVVTGQTLTLSVSISNFNINLTSISWTKDGNSLTSGQDRVTITNPTLPATTAPVNSTLQLTSTLPSDSGSYVITSTNAAGSDNFTFSVSITGPPQIVGGPQNLFSINNGSSAVFVCDAIADPPHVISWSFTNSSGSEISEIISTRDTDTANNKYTINVNREEMSFGELTVNNVTFKDRGTYKCTASNVFGEVSVAANLTVHVIPILRGISQHNIAFPSEPVAIFCLATGYPIPTFTWQKNGVNLSGSSGDRINIFSFFPELNTSINEFESNGFRTGGGRENISNLLMINIDRDVITSLGELGIVGVLSFDGVISEDTDNYTCTISNELSQTIRITRTSDPVPLIVLETAEITITGPNAVMAGEQLVLTCTVLLETATAIDSLLISWNGPPNEEMSGVMITSTLPNNILLIFDSIRTSHAGNYTFSVSSPSRVRYINTTHSITVRVPEPSVTITGSPINDHFYTGLQLNLTCQVEFILPVDTELRLSVTWMKAQSKINSDRITVLGSERVSLNPMKYDSLLIFSPLSITSGDEGIYICSVSVTQNSAYLEGPQDVTTNRTITIEIMMFQLRFPITSECSIWINDNPISKAEDIAANIVNELRRRCQCDFVRDRITNGGFICFSESPRHVTYRAEIHGTLQASTSQLVTHLESWIASNTPISVQAQLLIPDMTCAVAISSPSETECRPEATVVVSEDPNTAIAGIIAGIIGIVLFIGAILLVVTTIIIILRHRRISVLNLQKSTTQDTFGNPAVQLSTISQSGHDAQSHLTQSQPYGDVTEGHEYDSIGFQNTPKSEGLGETGKGGEYSFVECVAYSTNKAVKGEEGSLCEEVPEDTTTSVKLEGTTETSQGGLYDDIFV